MALRYGLAVIALSASAFAQTPNLVANGIVNGASFDGTQGVSQGSLVSLFGTSLASRLALADSLPLSTSMGDVTVTFNGLRAPLLAVIPGAGGGQDQINGQVPWNVLPAGADGGTASVVVTRGGVSSPPQNVQITRSAPGIFSVQFGVGYAIAINPDSTLAAPVGSIPGPADAPGENRGSQRTDSPGDRTGTGGSAGGGRRRIARSIAQGNHDAHRTGRRRACTGDVCRTRAAIRRR